MMRQPLLTPAAWARRASGAGAVFATPTSAARMAPPGPEPRTILRSTPRSAARRRALGDAAGGASEARPPPGGSPPAFLLRPLGRLLPVSCDPGSAGGLPAHGYA